VILFTPLHFGAPFSGLRGKYDDHLRLIAKCVLVLTERFSLGVKAEALRANISSKSAISLQWWPVDPKFQVEGVAPTNHSSSQKTRLNDLSYSITRNSSGDEIANVNFLYDDIVHVLQNTIDSCIPPQIEAAVMYGTHAYQIQ